MSPILLPTSVAVALTHAEVQAIAERNAVDLLHIKGPALAPSLLRPWPDNRGGQPRTSSDADVLVRPRDLGRLAQALTRHGWRLLYDFADGSAFEHAATWAGPDLASLDVHRYFPGVEMSANKAFDLLWGERQTAIIAGISCQVPSLTAQRLIVLIHAARGDSVRDKADRQRAWYTVSDSDRSAVDDLADRLQATVALRAGTGRIDTVRGERTYPLWQHLTSGSRSRTGLWWARVRSAPDLHSAVRAGVRMVVPNLHRLETRLGRAPTRTEVLAAYRARVRYAARQVSSAVRAQGKRRS